MNSLTSKIKNLKSWLIDVRRDLHKTPELGLEEFLTKEKIIKYLEEIGIDYTTYPDHTGVMAYINKNAKNTVAIRADIDALPIVETNNKSYKSIHSGKMHACGHDVHTSILLGVSKVLNEIKDEINGNVKFVDTSDFKSWVKNLENISEGDKSDVLTELKNHVSDMATEIKKEDVAGEMQYLYAILLKIN